MLFREHWGMETMKVMRVPCLNNFACTGTRSSNRSEAVFEVLSFEVVAEE